MKKFIGFERGMGLGGWLTNYKRFHVLGNDKKSLLTVGDLEHFQSYITEQDVKNISEMGFDHIRLGFDQVVLENEKGEYREEHFQLIDNFIAWCEKYRLNVILNLHKAVGNYCDVEEDVNLLDSEILQKRFIKFWSYVEERYSNKPALVFELLNELTDVDAEKWNSLAERTINAIRKTNEFRKIIIGPTRWNSLLALKDLKVFDDENVIYTFHMYEPFEFTHQKGVLQTRPALYNRVMPYPSDIERYRDYCEFFDISTSNKENAYKNYSAYEKMDAKYIQDYLLIAKEWMEKNPNKILWCGEFGTIRHAKLEWRIAWFKDVIRFFKEHNIPYSVWNYLSTPNDGNRFSLVDDDNRKILSPEFLHVLLGEF